MRESFAKSLSWVRADEGGNDDDPDDHGGRTSRGIIQREYNAWRVEQGLPPADVWTASDEEIDSIYLTEYWLPEGDWLPIGIDYAFFDFKVNAGPYRATVLLQRALGVAEDGRIGPITRAAIRAANPKVLLVSYSNAKVAFYRSLHQPKFLRGWLDRVARVQGRAMAMIGA